MYRLIFLSGRYQGKRLVVRQGITWLGHDSQSHIPLAAEENIAARHAQLEDTGSGVYLSPLADDAPIRLNGELIAGAVRLQHDDEFLLGNLRVQYQEIIAPRVRQRPSPGLLQPVTLLLALGILATEIIIIAFMVKWPERLILPQSEATDIAQAEVIRVQREAEKEAEGSGAASSHAATGTVVTLPGTSGASTGQTAETEKAAVTNAAAEVLQEADFTPAELGTTLTNLPAATPTDPRIEQAQRLLSEAVAAIQFADYPTATRLLNQVHQLQPGYAPAHVEHARLLELRGELDAAQQRWTQIMGMVAEDSAIQHLAKKEKQRLADLRAQQTQVLATPATDTPPVARLPRQIRIVTPPVVQKMPADANVEEMRILNAEIALAPDASLFKDAAVQVVVTFYDITTDGQMHPTRAITHGPALITGGVLSGGKPYPVQATYVAPPGLRTREASATGQRSSYYGFTLHVFAGRVLQDAIAKPKKLLDLPIQLPADPH